MRILTQQGWLTPLTIDHADALFPLIHHSRGHLYPWMTWLRRIHSPQDTAVFIEELTQQRGPQFLIIAGDSLCGSIGFYEIDRTQQLATLGYWLGQEFTGQGIMTDAVQSLCHYGFTELGLQKIEIRCATENWKSRQIPERLGFYLEGVEPKAEWLIDYYVDHAVYSMLKEEFLVCFYDTFAPHYQL